MDPVDPFYGPQVKNICSTYWEGEFFKVSTLVIDRNQYFDRDRSLQVTLPKPRPNRNTALTDAKTEPETETETV